VSGGDIPPSWILFPALERTFVWIAHNEFGLSQTKAKRLWPALFAELQDRPFSWRLQLSARLQDKRIDDGRLSGWARLKGPDWVDGTVRTPTWNRFMAMSSDEGDRMLAAWGLLFSEHGLDLKAVFGKRFMLEASRDDMRDLLEWELARQQAMQPLPLVRVELRHGPLDHPRRAAGAPPKQTYPAIGYVPRKAYLTACEVLCLFAYNRALPNDPILLPCERPKESHSTGPTPFSIRPYLSLNRLNLRCSMQNGKS
jgi:hypothetical protein